MLTNLLTAVKASWHAKLNFMQKYIIHALEENGYDLDCMIDQLLAEELWTRTK